MKKILYSFLFLSSMGCYTMYGLVLQQEKSNIIPSKPHVNYTLKKTPEEIPKSIIFIIADGTGIGQYSLSYYANGAFAPARFHHIGLVATHPNHGQCGTTCKRVTDSAASGTALSSGIKSYNGAIGVDTDTLAVKTMLEWAEEKNMATGLVATSTVTHATPASFAAHVEYRKLEAEIARQFAGAEIETILGGGKKYWPEELINEFVNKNGQFISRIDADVDPSKRLLGLFSEDALPAAHEGRNPSTTEMVMLAINHLDENPNGFFVMIEESQVDWGGHANSAEYIRGEMASLNDLVNHLLDYQLLHPEVLVVLTADHECGGVVIHDGPDSDLDVRFTSDYHSANFVPVFATGPGAEVFDGFFDNTEIGKILINYIRANEINAR